MRSEPRLGPHFKPALLRREPDRALLIEGEVETVAQKRLALERLAALPDIDGIVDRLHVRPAARMSDDGIRDRLRKAFLQEPAFEDVRIVQEKDNTEVQIRAGASGDAEITFAVADGIVTLNGRLNGSTSKRLAGVLCWWVPGTRDVVNGLAVEPYEEDAPIQIEEAVRIALEKDRLLDASQIKVGVRGRVVRLTGFVRFETMRDAAEADAWYVFGVDDVVNDIEVGP
jgi:osmotically-inducible protein OsmY